jgi:phosphoribosyl 1,2-cyclic phosphodiesterase
MEVRFWGVRGSIAVCGKEYLDTGGNTSCVEVSHEGVRLILDGGTGMRSLGDSLGCTPHRLTILFSHVHWDHIQGVPFFQPAFHPGSDLTFIGAERPSGTLRDALARQMQPPQWPVGLDAFRAQVRFGAARAGQSQHVGPFQLTPIELQHPDGVLAWHIQAGSTRLVYATDVEHDGQIDPRLLDAAQGADLLIHDAQYTEAEYRGDHGMARRGWGHSTWPEAVQCARSAKVQRLALFHHDPKRTDREVARMEAAARHRHPGAFAAREGVVVSL